jgi:hypothetical protein
MMELVIRTILSGVLLFSARPGHLEDASFEWHDGQKSEQTSKEFRYVIISESVEDADDPDIARRNVEVLLDERAFSEETLKRLFDLCSLRFPKPDWMFVWVSTNLKQVATPEERDLPSVSESKGNPESDKYHWAVLIRDGDNELFRYNPNPPSPEIKTVILKGAHPFASKKR